MNKKVILGLIIALAVVMLVYVFITEKQKKKKAELITPTPLIPTPIPTGQPALATNPIYGQYPTYPAQQPIQTGTANNSSFPLGIGSTGIFVKMIQAALGLKVDGKLGTNTQAAIIKAGIDVSSTQKFIDKFVSVDADAYAKNFPLKRGSKNNYVKGLQILLNLTPDGTFGAKTEAAVQTAIGKTIVYHADYTALLSAQTGIKPKYNGKQIDENKFASLASKIIKFIPLPGYGF